MPALVAPFYSTPQLRGILDPMASSSLPSETIDMWAARICQAARLSDGAAILLAGADSMAIAEALLRRGDYQVTVVDLSENETAPSVNQGLQIISVPPALTGVRPHSTDCLFLSHVWRHVSDLAAAADGWFHVLAPAGTCLIRHLPHAQMEHMLEYTFFPRALALDLARTPDIEDLRELLRQAGFGRVRTHHLEHRVAQTPEDRLRRIAGREPETLAELSEQEFQQGLTALEEHFLMQADSQDTLLEPQALTVARKPRRRS